MSRLIDADEAIKRIDHYPPDIRDTAKKELRYCKTVDAVPVVRCKYCKERMFTRLSDGKLVHYCELNDRLVDKDWFCADGKKVTE